MFLGRDEDRLPGVRGHRIQRGQERATSERRQGPSNQPGSQPAAGQATDICPNLTSCYPGGRRRREAEKGNNKIKINKRLSERMGKVREPRSRGTKFGDVPLSDDRRPCCRRAPTLRWCVGFSGSRMAVLIGGEPTARPAGGSEIAAAAAAAPDPPGHPAGRRVQPGLA